MSEQKFDVVRLLNWLKLFGMQPIGVPVVLSRGKVAGRWKYR